MNPHGDRLGGGGTSLRGSGTCADEDCMIEYGMSKREEETR